MHLVLLANNSTSNDATSSGSGNSEVTSNNSHGCSPLQSLNTKSNGNLSVYPDDVLSSFRDVPDSEKQSLFIKKLNLCCVVFDFMDPAKNLKEKCIKRKILVEIVDYISSRNGEKFTHTLMQEIIQMVSLNLFRSTVGTLPSRENIKILEGIVPPKDPAWPHLQIVIKCLLSFVASPHTDAKLAKRFIDHTFVLRLLDLFDSEDSRLRRNLKPVVLRIYVKLKVRRSFIRKAINNIFYRFVYETEKHNGIAELLQILGKLNKRFVLPLTEDHKLFLVRALIPLHKPNCMPVYHMPLSYCTTQFVKKDCKLSDTVIKGLLKYWPITNSTKEVIFLAELEKVLEATQFPEFQLCMVPLFRQISRCLSSLHFQVAMGALFLLKNDHIRNLIKQNLREILPIVFPAMEKNGRNHWNQEVQTWTAEVSKIYSDADPELYGECFRKFQEEDNAQEKEINANREAMETHGNKLLQ